jgi:predicted DNA-binding protein
MKKEETITLTLRLPISKKLRLEIIANKESRTLNSLCNKIIMDYMKEYERKK